MFSGIQFTLYEIFGYMFPGVIGFFALALLYWTVFLTKLPLSYRAFILQDVVIILVISYLIGHLIQALANQLLRPVKKIESTILVKGASEALPAALLDKVQLLVRERFNLDANKLQSEQLVKLCYETVTQKTAVNQVERFEYREGFYKGLFVSFGLLSFGVATRSIIPPFLVNFGADIVQVPLLLGFSLCILTVFAAFLSYFRYRRFRKKRVEKILYHFIVSAAEEQLKVKLISQ